MNRRNYFKELERLIGKQEGRPSLLLHACCGPCSSGVLEYLTEHFDITILWYNPNLFPEEEFEKRYDALAELLEKMGLKDTVPVIKEPWASEDYYEAVRGLEDEPEGGERCKECFRVRLEKTARAAKEKGFDFFCTTLTVSRHKNAVLINAIGEHQAEMTGAVWLPSDFKKHDGENRAVEMSEKYGIYRQVYCGCEFSLINRLKGKTNESP